MPRNSMPEGWEPPAPAWKSNWSNPSDPLVSVYFGIQADEPTLLEAWVAKAFSTEYGPESFERAKYIDQKGVTNYLYIAYWRLSNYLKWWAIDGHASWWADEQRTQEGVGYWREVFAMPVERFETLHSTETTHGVGVLSEKVEGPILEHGYAGGMRDRIELSGTDSLKNIDSVEQKLPARVSVNGARVVVTPPENMCVIRSGQNWTYCEPEETKYYLNKLHPVLQKGMRFLRDNPIETKCYSMRFADKKNADWSDTNETFGLGYAVDVYAFENWAKSHPTHLAIFGGFMQMVQTFGETMKLRLWHEVTALPKDNCEFEYISCHANTGLLGYI